MRMGRAGLVRIVPLFALFLSSFPVVGQVTPSRLVPVEACSLLFNTDGCFTPDTQGSYRVGREVTSLSSLYNFCLKVDKLQNVPQPVRVVLVIDESSSMCNTDKPYEHNDLEDKRIYAAWDFVKRLAQRSPVSEVAIVPYEGRANTRTAVGPLRLDNHQNIESLRAAILSAACNTRLVLSKSAKTMTSSTGKGIEEGLRRADSNFVYIDGILERHIIVLTDGAWDGTPMPSALLNSYASKFPGREFPTIHAVFIQDQSYHKQYCTTAECKAQLAGYSVTLDSLEYISRTRTGGLFFPATTPQTVGDQFLQLLKTISLDFPDRLIEVTVTNQTTGETARATFTLDTSATFGENVWRVTPPSISLAMGVNSIQIKRVMASGSTVQNVKIERVNTLVRDMSTSQLTDARWECGIDTFPIAAEAAPSFVQRDSLITVSIEVDSIMAALFAPAFSVRFYTPYLGSETGARLLYHLNGNARDTLSGIAASGSPSFHAGDGFGGCMSGGSLNITMPSLSGEYTMAAWVKFPADTGSGMTLFSSGDLTLGITGSGRLTISCGATKRELGRLDRGVWQHVAVEQQGNTRRVKVNGLDISGWLGCGDQAVPSILTVSVSNGGMVDEIWIADGIARPIPQSSSITWIIGSAVSSSASATVPASAWSGGTVSFKLRSDALLTGIVGFGADDGTARSWQKTATPVVIGKPQLLPPVAQPGSGGYEGKLVVTLSNDSINPTGSRIVYSTDGSDPLLGTRSSTVPVKLTIGSRDTVRIRAAAVAEGWYLPSEVVEFVYVNRGVLKSPSSNPPPAPFAGQVKVTLINPNAVLSEIWYTTDGSDPEPGENGTRYSWEEILVNDPESFEIRAVANFTGTDGFWDVSPVAVLKFSNIDSKGPRIVDAAFYPGNLPTDQGERKSDTLVVTFSEPVSCGILIGMTPARAVELFSNDTASAQALLSAVWLDVCNREDTLLAGAKLTLPPGNFRILPGRDAVRFQANAVPDSVRNMSPENAPRVKVRWGVTFEWTALVGPNPFVPGKSGIPESVRNVPGIDEANGVVIKVYVLKPSSAVADFYDAVGNIVLRKDFVRDPRDGILYLVWDGRTSSGRTVGSGTYTALISVEDVDGAVKRKRVKVGVRR